MLYKYVYIHKKEDSPKLIRSLIKPKILSDNFHSLPTQGCDLFLHCAGFQLGLFLPLQRSTFSHHGASYCNRKGRIAWEGDIFKCCSIYNCILPHCWRHRFGSKKRQSEKSLFLVFIWLKIRNSIFFKNNFGTLFL